ncbi:MAG: anti-sigma F factor antagonist [Anaerovoracaceae bacterium]
MHIEFKMTDDILIVSAFGELDHHTAQTLRQQVDEAMNTFKCKNLVLDFAQVGFMDSSGIGVVLGRYNKVKEKKGEIYLTGCSFYVEKILYMSGVFTIINQEKQVEDAIDKIKGQEQLRMEVKGNEQ